jgi:tRNA(Ile)-lysidine synthase
MDRLQVSGGPAPFPIRWLQTLERTIVERKLFRDGQEILVAVSCGLDSMTLLHALHQLSQVHRWKLTVAHFNHQLRGRAAEADEWMARDMAGALKLPIVAGRGSVRAEASRRKISLEMAGRDLRHRFLARAARARCIPVVALAHHADDQVELFFLRLFRGTSTQGLSGMKWAGPSPADSSILLVRPFLNQSKTALREVADAAGVVFSEDATNAQIDLERNRIRHVLLPLLEKHCPGRLTETVPRLMELAGAEAETVGALAENWLNRRRRAQFSRLPVAVQRRVIQIQLIAMKQAPAFEMVERLRTRPGEPFALDARRTISRSAAGMLQPRRIEPIEFNPARRAVLLKGSKGRQRIDGLAVCWELERTSGADFTREPNVEYFDADKVGSRIWLRHWRAGDRFQPIGVSSPRKLQDLLTNAKVPRNERHRRIVAATSRDEPFWVEGLRMAEPFKLQPATVRRLKWSWRREG